MRQRRRRTVESGIAALPFRCCATVPGGTRTRDGSVRDATCSKRPLASTAMPAPARGLLLLVDLDGVVYRGDDPVPGVAELLMERANRGDDVVYVTNNSMHYRADYVG